MSGAPITASARPFGPDGTPLSQMTDEGLLAEVEARRARRAKRTDGTVGGEPATKGRKGTTTLGLPRQVRQWLANLDLQEEASLEEVEGAYAALLERYSPALHGASPERRADAKALLASLKRAHEGLRLHFSRVR